MLICAGSCAPNQEEIQQPSVDPFFDVDSFFREEIAVWDSLQPTVTKQVLFDGVEEVGEFDSLDYDTQLRVFLDSDINKPAWFDKYRIDTIREEGRGYRVQYTSLSPKLRVQKLEVQWREGEPVAIHVEKATRSLLETLEQNLTYQTGEGFTLEMLQKRLWGKTTRTTIEVRRK